ncbi:MAG: ABC transporter substrate-binding protein [Sphaerochaetaceae bacterium]|nr:ABC transporter substrate-binding protein [Sphaerochaetaceae bacterium]
MKKTVLRISLILVAFLISSALLFAAGNQEAPKEKVTLTLLSHAVHENVARGKVAGTTGGDIVGEWAARNNVEIVWITAGIDPVHERLFRELALKETSIDVAFIIDKYVEPRLTSQLEPLDPFIAKAPIEDFDDIPANLLIATQYKGNIVAIPYRHSLGGLHWNEVLFNERGLTRPPKTIKELFEYAQKLTYKRDDGTEVTGYVANFGEGYASIYGFVRNYGVRLFTVDDDGKVTVAANTPEMVKGLTELATLYKLKAVPTNFATITIDEQNAMITTGRAAMASGPFARYTVYNNPDVTEFSGSIKVTKSVDVDENTPSDKSMEIWSMAIPKNSKHKDLAWDLIRELSSKENTVRAALNGNSPVRTSTYSDPRVLELFPWKVDEAEALQHAAVLPAFDNSLEAWQIFKEESQAAVIGAKSVQDAVVSMQSRLEKLLYK